MKIGLLLSLGLALVGTPSPARACTDGLVPSDASQSDCDYVASVVVDGGQTVAGNAVVTASGSDLFVTIHMDGASGWELDDLAVYAGPESEPLPYWAPGSYAMDFSKFQIGVGPADFTYDLTVSTPLPALASGEKLAVIIYVVATQRNSSGQIVVDRMPGWGYGPDHISFPCDGAYFTWNPVCELPPVEKGCTKTQGYWKNHNEFGKNKALKINWPSPWDENQKLCTGDARSLLTLISANSAGGNAYITLVRQLIAAELNIASGATTTPEVENALASAWDLVTANCGKTVKASTDTGQLMLIMEGVLDAYNNGWIGPGHCSSTPSDVSF